MAAKALKLTSKKPQHGGSVRVIFFFFAFCAICVYTPILIDDLLHRNTTAQEKILQGADPTTVLEATASGGAATSIDCDTSRYLFGRSSDGYSYVKDLNTNLYAVDFSGETKFLQKTSESELFSPVVSGHTEKGRELGNILMSCLKSSKTPKSSDTSFGKYR